MNVSIVQTNIVSVVADAIVLPANERLVEGSGASEAIFKAAGRKQLAKRCEEIGHCDVGSAVPTLAYDMDANCIIHAVVPRWIDGESGEYDALCSAYQAALSIADTMQCSSIAFPLLASGNNGFNKELAFQIAMKSFETFEPTNLKSITLVLYGASVRRMAEDLGFSVTVISSKISKGVRIPEVDSELLDPIKKHGKDFWNHEIEMAFEWLGKPENQKKVVEAAGNVLVLAMGLIKKK